jgi:hypothetical protein
MATSCSHNHLKAEQMLRMGQYTQCSSKEAETNANWAEKKQMFIMRQQSD